MNRDDQLKKLKDVVKSFPNGFEQDPYSKEYPDEVEFSSRKHGDVGAEKAGHQDVKDAIKIVDLCSSLEFVKEINYEIVDEWVIINIELKELFT